MNKLNTRTSDYEYKIDFSFTPSIMSIRRFAVVGRNIIELFWPEKKKCALEVEVCLVEALSNVLVHAKNGSSNSKISFQMEYGLNKLVIRVFDHGKGFILSDQITREDDLYRSNGRGLLIIKSFMDTLKYIQGDHRNELIFEKSISDKNDESA